MSILSAIPITSLVWFLATVSDNHNQKSEEVKIPDDSEESSIPFSDQRDYVEDKYSSLTKKCKPTIR